VEFVWERGNPLRKGGGVGALATGIRRLAATLRTVTVRDCPRFRVDHPALVAALAETPRLRLVVEGPLGPWGGS